MTQNRTIAQSHNHTITHTHSESQETLTTYIFTFQRSWFVESMLFPWLCVYVRDRGGRGMGRERESYLEWERTSLDRPSPPSWCSLSCRMGCSSCSAQTLHTRRYTRHSRRQSGLNLAFLWLCNSVIHPFAGGGRSAETWCWSRSTRRFPSSSLRLRTDTTSFQKEPQKIESPQRWC